MPRAEAIAIGGSAGAVHALLALLPGLPADYPVPILVAIHVPPDRANMLVPLFQARCALVVKEGEDKEMMAAGHVYFAPSNYHLLVEHGASLALSADAPVHNCRPSIDVLLESAAEAIGPALVAIILTGANADGAAGLAAVAIAGGRTIVQDPSDAEIAAMPLAALSACPGATSWPLARIADFLRQLSLK